MMRLFTIAAFIAAFLFAGSASGQSPQDAAQAKANACASAGRLFHPFGSRGGCTHEGVGMGGTPQAAEAACCYSGRMPLVASAVARGRNGLYYACRLFHPGGADGVGIVNRPAASSCTGTVCGQMSAAEAAKTAPLTAAVPQPMPGGPAVVVTHPQAVPLAACCTAAAPSCQPVQSRRAARRWR